MRQSLPLFDLTSKIALVTGGGSGIGLAIATALAGAGATVVIAGRNQAKAEQALRHIGHGARYVILDLAKAEECRAAVARLITERGGIDILVNNAGIVISGRPQDVMLEDWRQMFDVNVTGALLLSQAAYPEMRRRGGGKIINVGSIASLFGTPGAAAYGASKGAIAQLTKSLAVAWAADNIQVNAILPGYIDTEMGRENLANRPEYADAILARTPARRFGRPDDFVGVALLLASAASQYITGTVITVDGGYSSQI